MTKDEILNNLNIKIDIVKQKNKVKIINNKYVIKKQSRKSDFYDYLINRGFNNFPKVYTKVEDEIELYDYIEEKEVPLEQKLEDLVYLISILHVKTIFDKEISIDKIKEIYETNIEELDNNYNYYFNIQDNIESKAFMSPANYYLMRNISIIYKSIILSKNYLEEWYKKIENNKKMRYSYIHNNLKKDHIIENNNLYLISWDKSKIDLSINDIINLYQNNYYDISIKDIIKIYEQKLPLTDIEKYLLFSLLLKPKIIDFNNSELDNIDKEFNMIYYLDKTYNDLKDYFNKSNNNINK